MGCATSLHLGEPDLGGVRAGVVEPSALACGDDDIFHSARVRVLPPRSLAKGQCVLY